MKTTRAEKKIKQGERGGGQNQTTPKYHIYTNKNSLSLSIVLLKFYGNLPTVFLLHRDCGYRAYTVISVDDLYNPFASMYFGAAYLGWLSKYEGRSDEKRYTIFALVDT
jgi:hypothetical protein